MFKQQVSYTTWQSQGAHTAPVQQAVLNTHPRGDGHVDALLRLTRAHWLVLNILKKNNRTSMALAVRCGSAAARSSKKGITEV